MRKNILDDDLSRFGWEKDRKGHVRIPLEKWQRLLGELRDLKATINVRSDDIEVLKTLLQVKIPGERLYFWGDCYDLEATFPCGTKRRCSNKPTDTKDWGYRQIAKRKKK